MDRHVKLARPPFREEAEKTRIGAAASDCVGSMIFVEAIDCRAPPRHPALFFTGEGRWPLPAAMSWRVGSRAAFHGSPITAY